MWLMESEVGKKGVSLRLNFAQATKVPLIKEM